MRTKVKVTSREDVLKNFTREFLIEEKKRCEIDRYVTDFRILIHNMPHENHNYLNRLLQDYTSMFLSHERISVNKSNEGEMKHRLRKQLASKIKESPKQRYVKSKLSSKFSENSDRQSYLVLKAKTEEFLQKLRKYDELEQIAYEIFIEHSNTESATKVTCKRDQSLSDISSKDDILKLKTIEVPLDIPYKKNVKHVYVVNSAEPKHLKKISSYNRTLNSSQSSIATTENLLTNFEYIKNKTSEFLQNCRDYNDAEQRMFFEQYQQNVYIRKYAGNLNIYKGDDPKRRVTPKKGFLYKIKNMMGFSPEKNGKFHESRDEEIPQFKEETKAFLQNERKFNDFEFKSYKPSYVKNSEFEESVFKSTQNMANIDAALIKKNISVKETPNNMQIKMKSKNAVPLENSPLNTTDQLEEQEFENLGLAIHPPIKNKSKSIEKLEHMEFGFDPSCKNTKELDVSVNNSSIMTSKVNPELSTEESISDTTNFHSKNEEITDEHFKILREQTRKFVHEQQVYGDQQKEFHILFSKEHPTPIFRANNKRESLLNRIKHLFKFGKSDKSKEKLYYFRKLTDEFLRNEKNYSDQERNVPQFSNRSSDAQIHNIHTEETHHASRVEKERQSRNSSPKNSEPKREFVLSPSVLHQRSRSEDLLTFKARTKSLDNASKKSPTSHKSFSERLKRMVGIGNRRRTKSRENISRLTDPVQYFLDHERFNYDVNVENSKKYSRSISLMSPSGKKNTIKTKTRNFLSTENILYQDPDHEVKSKPPSGRRRQERRSDDGKNKRRSRTLSPAQKIVSKLRNIVHRDGKNKENEKENWEFVKNETEKFISDQKSFNDLMGGKSVEAYSSISVKEFKKNEIPESEQKVIRQTSSQTKILEQYNKQHRKKKIEIQDHRAGKTKPRDTAKPEESSKLVITSMKSNEKLIHPEVGHSSKTVIPKFRENQITIVDNSGLSRNQTEIFLNDMKKFHDLDREASAAEKTLIFVNNKSLAPTSIFNTSESTDTNSKAIEDPLIMNYSTTRDNKNEKVQKSDILKNVSQEKALLSKSCTSEKIIKNCNVQEISKESLKQSFANGVQSTISKKETKVITQKVVSETPVIKFTSKDNQRTVDDIFDNSRKEQILDSTRNDTSENKLTSHRFEDKSKAIHHEENKKQLKDATNKCIRNEKHSSTKTEKLNMAFIEPLNSVIGGSTENNTDDNTQLETQTDIPIGATSNSNTAFLNEKESVHEKKNTHESSELLRRQTAEFLIHLREYNTSHPEHYSKFKVFWMNERAGFHKKINDNQRKKTFEESDNKISNEEQDSRSYLLMKQQTSIFLKDHQDFHNKQRHEDVNFLREVNIPEKKLWLSTNFSKAKKITGRIKKLLSPTTSKKNLIITHDKTGKLLREQTEEFLNKQQYFIYEQELNFKTSSSPSDTTVDKLPIFSKITTSHSKASKQSVQETPTEPAKATKSRFYKIKSLLGGSSNQHLIKANDKLDSKQTAVFLDHLKTYTTSEYENSSKLKIFWLSEREVISQKLDEVSQPTVIRNLTKESETKKLHLLMVQQTNNFLNDHKDFHNKQRIEENFFLKKIGIPEERISTTSTTSKDRKSAALSDLSADESKIETQRAKMGTFSKIKYLIGGTADEPPVKKNDKLLCKQTAEFLEHLRKYNNTEYENSTKSRIFWLSELELSKHKRDRVLHNELLQQDVKESSSKQQNSENESYLFIKQETDTFLKYHKDYHNKQRNEDVLFLQKTGIPEEQIWLSTGNSKNESIKSKIKKLLSPTSSKKSLISNGISDQFLKNQTTEFLVKNQYFIHEDEIRPKIMSNSSNENVKEVPKVSKCATSHFSAPSDETGKAKMNKFSNIAYVMSNSDKPPLIPQKVDEVVLKKLPSSDKASRNEEKDRAYNSYLLMRQQTDTFLQDHKDYHDKQRKEHDEFLQKSGIKEQQFWLSSNIPKSKSLSSKIKRLFSPAQPNKSLINTNNEKNELVKDQTAQFLSRHQYLIHEKEVNHKIASNVQIVPVEKKTSLSRISPSDCEASQNEVGTKSAAKAEKKKKSTLSKIKYMNSGTTEQPLINENIKVDIERTAEFLRKMREYDNTEYDTSSKFKISWLSERTKIPGKVDKIPNDNKTRKILGGSRSQGNYRKYESYLFMKQQIDTFMKDHKDYHDKQRIEDNKFLQKSIIPEEKRWLSSNISKSESMTSEMKKVMYPNNSKKSLVISNKKENQLWRDQTAEFLSKNRYYIYREEINFKTLQNPTNLTVKKESGGLLKTTSATVKSEKESPTKTDKVKKSTFTKFKSVMTPKAKQLPIRGDDQLISTQTAEFLEHLKRYNSTEYRIFSKYKIDWLSDREMISQTFDKVIMSETLRTKIEESNSEKNDQEYDPHLCLKQQADTLKEENGISKNTSHHYAMQKDESAKKTDKSKKTTFSKIKSLMSGSAKQPPIRNNSKSIRQQTVEFLEEFRKFNNNEYETSSKFTSYWLSERGVTLQEKNFRQVGFEDSNKQKDQEYTSYLCIKEQTDSFLKDHKNYHDEQMNEDKKFFEKKGTLGEKLWLSSNTLKNRSISNKIKEFLSPRSGLVTSNNENHQFLRDQTAEFLSKHRYFLHEEEVNLKNNSNSSDITVEEVPAPSNITVSESRALKDESNQKPPTKIRKTKKSTFSKIKSLMGNNAKQPLIKENNKIIKKETSTFLDHLRTYNDNAYEDLKKSNICWLCDSKKLPVTIEKTIQNEVPEGIFKKENDKDHEHYFRIKQQTDIFLKDHKDYHIKQRNDMNDFLTKNGLPEYNTPFKSELLMRTENITDDVDKAVYSRDSKKISVINKNDGCQLSRDQNKTFSPKNQYPTHQDGTHPERIFESIDKDGKNEVSEKLKQSLTKGNNASLFVKQTAEVQFKNDILKISKQHLNPQKVYETFPEELPSKDDTASSDRKQSPNRYMFLKQETNNFLKDHQDYHNKERNECDNVFKNTLPPERQNWLAPTPEQKNVNKMDHSCSYNPKTNSVIDGCQAGIVWHPKKDDERVSIPKISLGRPTIPKSKSVEDVEIYKENTVTETISTKSVVPDSTDLSSTDGIRMLLKGEPEYFIRNLEEYKHDLTVETSTSENGNSVSPEKKSDKTNIIKKIKHLFSSAKPSGRNAVFYDDEAERNQFLRKLTSEFLVDQLYYIHEGQVNFKEKPEKFIPIKVGRKTLVIPEKLMKQQSLVVESPPEYPKDDEHIVSEIKPSYTTPVVPPKNDVFVGNQTEESLKDIKKYSVIDESNDQYQRPIMKKKVTFLNKNGPFESECCHSTNETKTSRELIQQTQLFLENHQDYHHNQLCIDEKNFAGNTEVEAENTPSVTAKSLPILSKIRYLFSSHSPQKKNTSDESEESKVMKHLCEEFLKKQQYIVHEDEIFQKFKPEPTPRKLKVATKTNDREQLEKQNHFSEEYTKMRKDLLFFLQDHQTYHDKEKSELMSFTTHQLQHPRNAPRKSSVLEQKSKSKIMTKLKSLVGASTEKVISDKKTKTEIAELQKQTMEFLISQKCFWDLEGSAALRCEDKKRSLEMYNHQGTVENIGMKKKLKEELSAPDIRQKKELEKTNVPGEMLDEVAIHNPVRQHDTEHDNRDYNFIKEQTALFLHNHQIYHENQMKDFISFLHTRKQIRNECLGEDIDYQNTESQKSSSSKKTLEMDGSTESKSDLKALASMKVISETTVDPKIIQNTCEEFISQQRYYTDVENQVWRRYVMYKLEVVILKTKSSLNKAAHPKKKNYLVSKITPKIKNQYSEMESRKIDHEVTLHKTKLFLENHKNYHDNLRTEIARYVPTKKYRNEFAEQKTSEKKEGMLFKIKSMLPSGHNKNSYNVQQTKSSTQNGSDIKREFECNSSVAKFADLPKISTSTNENEVILRKRTDMFLRDHQEYHNRQKKDFMDYFDNNCLLGNVIFPKDNNVTNKKLNKGIVSKLKSLLGADSTKNQPDKKQIKDIYFKKPTKIFLEDQKHFGHSEKAAEKMFNDSRNNFEIKNLESSPTASRRTNLEKLSRNAEKKQSDLVDELKTGHEPKNKDEGNDSLTSQKFVSPEKLNVTREDKFGTPIASIDEKNLQKVPVIDKALIESSRPIVHCNELTDGNILKKLSCSQLSNISEDDRRKYTRDKIKTQEFLLNQKEFANESHTDVIQGLKISSRPLKFSQNGVDNEMTKMKSDSDITKSKQRTNISHDDITNERKKFVPSAPSSDQYEEPTDGEMNNIGSSLIQRIERPMSPTKTVFEEIRSKDNSPANRVYILNEGYTITRGEKENEKIKNKCFKNNGMQMRNEPKQTVSFEIEEIKPLTADISESVGGGMHARNKIQGHMSLSLPFQESSDGTSNLQRHADMQRFLDAEKYQSSFSNGQDCSSSSFKYSHYQRTTQGDLGVGRQYTKRRTYREMEEEPHSFITETRIENNGTVTQRYTTSCYFHQVPIPVWYSESLLVDLEDKTQKMNEKVYYDNQFRPEYWSETFETEIPQKQNIFVAETVIPIKQESDDIHYISLEHQQLNTEPENV